MNGGATIQCDKAYFVGNYSGGGLTTATGSIAASIRLSILMHRWPPAYTGCNTNKYKLTAGKNDTKNIGGSGIYVFCNGLELTGNSSLTLGPGTFIIDRRAIDFQGGSTLTATDGTTILLTTTDPSKTCAVAKINGGAIVTLRAPTSGSLAGIAMYQDRRCSDHTLSSNLNGGGTQNITGAIYFPGAKSRLCGRRLGRRRAVHTAHRLEDQFYRQLGIPEHLRRHRRPQAEPKRRPPHRIGQFEAAGGLDFKLIPASLKDQPGRTGRPASPRRPAPQDGGARGDDNRRAEQRFRGREVAIIAKRRP